MADPTPAKTIWDSLPNAAWTIALLIIGGLVAHSWTKFRNRTKRFTWAAWHSQNAVAGASPALGAVTVQHNGVNVNHLHATTVEFQNDSNEDAKDIVLTLSFYGVGHVLNSIENIEGVVGSIPLDSAYGARLVNATTPAQANLVNSEIVYRIPVLNRRKKATFHLLVRRDDLSNPVVLASCNHLGWKLEPQRRPAYVVWGESRDRSVLFGLVLTIPTVAALIHWYHHPRANTILAYLLGITVAAIGAGLVKVLRGLGRIIG